jgi:glycosyltransferase involved in cell wall biosynthesis
LNAKEHSGTPGFSIVLCTYNRADILPISLEWLNNLELPAEEPVELVIVDNASTDSTPQVIKSFARASQFLVKHVFEPRPGLSAARNAGIQAASGRIIVFTDDDCLVSSTWLLDLETAYRNDPGLSGVGGRVELYDLRDLALTIRTSETTSEANARNIFAQVLGCNMSFRSPLFDEHGAFDEAFGAGSRLRSAEDSDFLYRLVKSGKRIQYSPTAVVFHAHGRRSESDAKSLSKNYVIGRGGFYCKHIFSGDKQILKQAYWEMRRSLLGSLKPSGAMRPLRNLGYLVFGMALYVPIHVRRTFQRSNASSGHAC